MRTNRRAVIGGAAVVAGLVALAVVRGVPVGRVGAVALGGLAAGAAAALVSDRRPSRRGAGVVVVGLWLAAAALTGAFATFVASTTSTLPVTTLSNDPTFTEGYDPITVDVGAAVTPQTPTVVGGVGPYGFAASPALLGGLALDASTGQISGSAGGNVAQVAAGAYHACARFVEGTVKCWGSNESGQLGLGDTDDRGDEPGELGDDLEFVQLGTGRTVVSIATGGLHSCALLDDASVKCWGENGSGQLGLGDTDDRGDAPAEMGEALPAVALGAGRTAVAIAAGFAHTCAVLDDESLKCWGDNGSGRLGLGDTDTRGDAGGEMGDALPTVALGTGMTVTDVAAGFEHTCALFEGGPVKCWGRSNLGQLGQGDTASRGDDGGEMGDDLPPIALGSGRTAVSLAVGGAHNCVRLDDATAKCWGHNADGELGLGDAEHRGDDGGEMGDDLPAVALGAGRSVSAVAAGYLHSCARLDDGSVKCWGENGSGQLGLGDIDDRGDTAGEMDDDLPPAALGTGRTALAISAGVSSTCARLDDSSVKCWGSSSAGQLGFGNTEDRGDGPNEMGDYLFRIGLGTFVRESTVTVTDDNGNTDDATVEITLRSDSGSVPEPPSPTVDVDGTSVDVAWSPVTGAATYDIQRQLSGGAFSALVEQHTVTSYDDTGLGTGLEYGYQVRACNVLGCSAWSSTSSATTVPGVPSAPSLTPGYRTVSVSWSSVTGASSYDIQRNESGGEFGDHTSDQTSPYADSGLSDNTVYGYRVRACNASGCSDWSAGQTGTTAPGIPTGYVVGVSGKTVLAIWNNMAGASTYELDVGASGGITPIVDDFDRADSASSLGSTSDGSNAWTAAAGTWGIDEGQAYLASNPGLSIATVDLGSPDGFVQFTLGAGAETAQGAVFRYEDANNYWYALAAPSFASWRLDKVVDGVVTQVQTLAFAPTGAGTVARFEFDGATIRSYFNEMLWNTTTDAVLSGKTRVGLRAGTGVSDAARWDDFSAGLLPTVTSPVTGLVSNVYVDTALASGTTYTYRARACNASSVCSDWTSSAGGTSSPVSPSLGAFPIGTSSISLGWTASSGATSYEWDYRVVGGAWAGPAATTDLDALQTGLAAGTNYELRVRACRAGVCSPWKTAFAATTANAVPDAPTAVSGFAGNGAVAVSWLAPAAPNVVGTYQVRAYVSGVEIVDSPKNAGTATTYLYTGLDPASAYTFRVEASNDAGTSALSAASSAITPNSAGNRLAPDAVLSSANLSGPAVGPISDDPDDYTLDSTWLEGTSTTAHTRLRVSFPTPPGTISGTQQFKVFVKKRNNPGFSTNAIVVLRLYEAGQLVSWSANNTVTSTASSGLLTYTWSATDRTPADIELEVEQTGNANVTLDIYAVEWNAAPHTFVVPYAPTSVSGTAGAGQVTLTWAAPTAVDAPVRDYRVRVLSASGGTPVGVIGPSTRQLGANATSYTFSGLKPGTAYTFTVEAYNGSGWGPSSAASGSVTPTY